MTELTSSDAPVVTFVTVGVVAPTETAARAVLRACSDITMAVLDDRDPFEAVARLAELADLLERPAGERDALLQVWELLEGPCQGELTTRRQR